MVLEQSLHHAGLALEAREGIIHGSNTHTHFYCCYYNLLDFLECVSSFVVFFL